MYSPAFHMSLPRNGSWRRRLGMVLSACFAVLVPCGCQTTPKQESRPIGEAVAERTRGDRGRPSPADAPLEADGDPRGGESQSAIAYVNGKPIARARVVSLLLAGHGVGVLEQIVVLERAKQMAAEQGLQVTQRDIAAEHERALRALLSPMESADESAFDRAEGERLLASLLSRRNVSRAEYDAGIVRNAYLRAIVTANMKLTPEQVREEFERSFGRRVEIRHIQLASLADAERVAVRLQNGEDFDAVARRYSANPRTGPAGGRLRPFSENDEEVPEALRRAAFRMEPGRISPPIRAGDWYHIIEVSRVLPRESSSLESVRPEVEARLRQRLTDPAMHTLYKSLFEQADLRIEDPDLAAEFARKHPDRRSASSN